MKYSELVSSNQNFHSSVNLQFDLNKENKINAYIPTQQSVQILKQYLDAVYNKKGGMINASVLVGPYGRGKSHLLLILSAIVSGAASGISLECLNNLVKRISAVDKDAALLAKKIISRKTSLLTVLVNSNHIDLNQAFIVALRDAFERTNLNDIFPETYFDTALNTIQMWENDYPDTIKIFKKHLKANKITLSDFKKQIRNCSRDAYNVFCEVYPKITSGTQFNPMQNADVVYLYNTVLKALESKGYEGYLIIFDEFSKFLESTSIKPDMQNMNLIQEFCELCVRGAGLFCCVTHKEILEYSSNDGFRTVDGRLKTVKFIASEEQSYELLSNAIVHKRKFSSYYKANSNIIDEIGANAYRTGAFSSISESNYKEIIQKNCFPLHPLAVMALICVSELVGQNERTLFTFLSENGEHSFNDFISKDYGDSVVLLTADIVFDYFADQFMLEVYNNRIIHNWAKAMSALKQATDKEQGKIIKAIALIYILNNDKLIPTANCIKTFLNMDDEVFGAAISELENNHIVTLMRNGKYAFLTANGVDIQKDVHNCVEQHKNILDRPNLLKSISSTSFILPRQYNAKHCMLRYFRTCYMEADDYLAYNGNFSEYMAEADGLVVYLISNENTDKDIILEHISHTTAGYNIVICISEAWEDDTLLSEYDAACALEKRINNDMHYIEELQVYKNDRYKFIRELVEKIYAPSNPNTIYFNSNCIFENVFTYTQLNRELSRVCEKVYYCTPTINNELINKNNLSAPIKKARASIVNFLLNNKESFEPIKGSGPDATAMRATLVANKLNEQDVSTDANLNAALDIIRGFVKEAETRKVSFGEIYALLTAAPFGMRRGVIPVFIAYIMRNISERIIIKLKESEQELDGETFNSIDDKGKTADYTFTVEAGTAEMNAYIDGIISAFNCKNTAVSKRKAAVMGMQAWYRNLPKFSRFFERGYGFEFKCTNSIKAFRALLSRYEVNCHDILFEIIPKTFETEIYSEMLAKLVEYKKISDDFMNSLKKYLINAITEIVNQHYHYIGSFVTIMNDWYNNLNDRTKNNIFDSDTNALLSYISCSDGYDDLYFVSELARRISDIPITEWSEMTVDNFIDIISCSFEKIYKFDTSDINAEGNDISVVLNIDNRTYEKCLSGNPIEGIAQTLLNNIQTEFDDYGDSVTPQERIAILLEVLKHEIDNM